MYPSSNQAAPGSTQPTTSEDVVSTEHARASTPVSAVDHEATKPASQPQMSTPTMVFTRQCTGSAHQRTPTPISNYAGLNFSTTSKGDNIAQLRFTDSPIEVKCRTRGGSRSPFLSTFQTELKFDLDLSNSHACGLALSERTSPVQATTPIFDSTGCGSFPQVVSRRVGNEAALLAPCPTRPRGDGARLTTVGAVPQSRTDDDDSRRGSQPVTHPSPMGHSRTAPTEESHDTQSGAAVLADWLALPNAAEANALCEEAGEPNSANSVAQAIAPAAPLPASVVHRVLQGRCRFIAFPTNLPVVLCKNSINTTAGSGPTSGSINSSSECHNNNANNTTNYSCTTTVTGSPVSGPMECCGFAHSGSDSQEKGATTHESASTMTAGTGSAHAGVHASTVTAPPASAVSTTYSNVMSKQISKSSFKEVTHALFIGQVRFETTPAELIWLVQRTTGACVSYLESRGAGCYLLYCKSEADLQLVRCLHKRILFDIGGVWLARTAEEIDALCEHIALDAAVLSRKARLPRDSMVVEDLKVDALDSNKHHSGGGGSSNNCSFNHGAAVGCLDYPGSKSFTHAKQSYHTRQPHHTSHHNSYSKCSNSVVNNPLSTYSNFSNDPSQCCTPRTRSKLIGTTVGNLNSSLDVACCTVSGQLAPQTYPSSQFTYPCNTMGACTESNNNNNSYAAHMSRHVACCEDMTGYLADSRCYSECMPIGTATATVSLSQHPRQSYQTIDAAPIMPNSAAQMGTKPNCPQECASPQPPPYRF